MSYRWIKPPNVPAKRMEDVSEMQILNIGSLKVKSDKKKNCEKKRIPYGDQSLFAGFTSFIVINSDNISNAPSSDSLCGNPSQFGGSFTEEIHLVYRAISGSGKEQSLCDVPSEI